MRSTASASPAPSAAISTSSTRPCSACCRIATSRRSARPATPPAPAPASPSSTAERAARIAHVIDSVPFITRKIPYYEILGEEGLALIEHNADTVLEEIGIDFKDDPEALRIWRDAGADVKGERVRFARGMCRAIIQK